MEHRASFLALSRGGSRACFGGRIQRHGGLILSLPLLALALPSSALAQRLTGALSGTVVDESGRGHPGRRRHPHQPSLGVDAGDGHERRGLLRLSWMALPAR